VALPDWLTPMAATLTQERFSGPEWIFERKYDGIRLLAYKEGERVRLYSRNRLEQQHAAIEAAVGALPAREVILDGEMAWSGKPAYHVFDILWLDGQATTTLPLEERQRLLGTLPLRAPLQRVVPLTCDAPWDRACREGWEGVIAKRRGSLYEHRRSREWLKMKCELKQPFVIGGFTDPQGRRAGLGALLVGYYDGDDFCFAGKVGTGLNTQQLVELRGRLDELEVDTAPFTRGTGLPRLRVHWVRPQLVVEVGFIEWTAYDKLRHPRLLGMRPGMRPRRVVRERP
jgi:bifunctional non-homologous end joining protein LigD